MRKNYGPERRDPAFYLDRTRYFLGLVGRPDKAAKFIHVTGTAGKGSVCTAVHSCLVAAGRTAGIFTSPYVTTTTEQIQVGRLFISAEDFVRIADSLRPLILKAQAGPYGGPSSFEILMTIALIYFKEQKCEWVVLEVGLGGRYDATNIIEDPAITAITMIDYDHTEILGKTLREIAYDKAGIIKKGSEFFTTERRPVLRALFERICQEQRAKFHAIPVKGSHLDANTALVRAIATAASVPEEAIKEGQAAVRMQCRFESVSREPLVILDGAHNRAKIRSTVSNLSRVSYKKLVVITGLSNMKKDARAVLEPLAACADHVIITAFGSSDRRSVHPDALLPIVQSHMRSTATVEKTGSVESALQRARELAADGDCILVTGSFFLAGEMRKKWYPESRVLEARTAFPHEDASR
jgi:dihydrofolate synthase/folylpolyglutamate synthase